MDTGEIVEKEIEEISGKDDVKAVAVVGSYARNPEGEHNDIDIFVIVEEDEEGSWRKRETEVVEGVVVERFYNSVEWAYEYLENEEWMFNYWWYTNADVRYDPDNIFDGLAEYSEEQKEKRLGISESDEELLLYETWDRWQDIESAKGPQKTYLMDRFFDYLVSEYYDVAGKVPVKENYRIERLKDFDEEMHRLAVEYLKASNPEKKEELLEWISERVTRDLGEPSPEYSTGKEYYGTDL